ncbi:choline transporter protein 2 [Echinococcus multilocularis]|uniref:Choline transporter-like protein n=1 Tax=Echinococcus multilocularis TaxID=6211 RepID=A0A087W176_ECHMU|nr:choline transporter protein 2 [Echinococcus multilocularis]
MGQKHSSQGNRATQSSVEDVSSDPRLLSVESRGDRKLHQEITLPVKNRSCTDALCCIIFIVCILLLACVAGFSYLMGDFRRVIFPKDSHAKICGVDYPEQKYLFFFDMFSCLHLPEVVIQYGCPTKQVCVSSCPNYTWKASEGDSFESRSKMICEGGVSGNFEAYKLKSVSDLIQSGICAPEVLPTEAMFRRCVQLDIVPAIDQLNRRTLANPEAERPLLSLPSVVLGARTAFTQVIEDIVRSWKVILVCILLAAIASFLWIFFMRMCTCAMVVFTLLAFVSIFGLATGFCFWRYVETKKVNANSPPLFLTLDITVYFRYSTTWLILGIISGLILFLVLLIIIFIREKIVLAYRVIGEASKAIGNLPMTLFWPIIPFILIFGTIALWIFVDLNLRSIAVSEGVHYANSTVGLRYKSPEEWTAWALNASMKCDPTANNTEGQICLFVKHITTVYTPWLQVYNFFMCVWLVNFFIAMDQITLAGAFATFYFNSQSQRRRHTIVGCCGLWLLFGTCVSALVYNTGSLALGSILITIFWFLRACLLRLERRLKTANNEIAQFFLRCFCCCLWCLEKFLRFLNKNAYIMIAIYGHGFCRSARDAFQLIVRNVVRVFLVEKITDYILVVGKLAVSAAASCLAYFYLGGVIPDKLNLVPEQNLQLNYIFVPILVIAIASYLVAKAFFSVYEMGVDTIFICVCEDLERNNGTVEKPYFMNKSTMKMLKKPDAETSLS